tara:strand:- start:2164 stop:2877 length:714 start_codon:yes stop_codon:yes gene_type:complete
MTNFLLKRILIFFDYFHKKKIIDNLKDLDFNNNLKIILDVGAHEGESIELFLKNLKVDNIYSFEPSEETFKILLKNSKKLKKKFNKTNIILENLAVGKANQNVDLNYLNETSSSTIRNINTNSDYFKKKEKYFGKLINKKIIVKQINFKEYLEKNKIEKIDLLKIDTEGYELEVLTGLGEFISNVSIILFEHHYDNMIVKDYTFSDIHKLLKDNGFRRIYKSKMPFRKSFDYIYIKA